METRAFEGVQAIYGPKNFSILENQHFLVLGIGGVGSWICEALARSGVKNITIVDLDDICVSNINRQIHATNKTVGKFKIDIMKERMLDINPEIKINCIHDFFTSSSADEILEAKFDYVFDAIDSLKSKAYLLSECKKRGIKVVTIGGAGGLKDPTKIEIKDLNLTRNDKLLQRLRKKLKQSFDFTKYPNKKFHIPAIYSTELIEKPQTECDLDTKNLNHKQNCNNGLGSLSFVTASFGFIAVSFVFEDILKTHLPKNYHD